MVRLKSVLLACAAAAAAQFTAAAALAQEIIWWAPDWGKARAEKLINDFQAANPDIKVKLEVTISNGLQNRIQVVLRGGSPPDLIDTSIQWVPLSPTPASCWLSTSGPRRPSTCRTYCRLPSSS